MISLKSLRKSYPSQQAVLKDVNISLSDTGFYLLLGESGSGKTTFLNVLAGILPFDEGSIEWNGESFYGQMPEMLHGEAEYMTQEAFFADFLSVSENLKVLGIDESTADEYLMRFGLAGKNDQYPPTLSGGERQRLSLARALIKGRKVLLLDEPTAALDADNKKKVFELLKKMSENILILCATHDSYAKDFADIILMFDKGAGRVEAEVQRSVNSGPTDESISEKSISVKLNNNETMSMRDALRYLSKWFHSGRRERFSYYAFIIFMTLSLSMICFADTPTHKSDVTMKNLYRLNMCKLTLHGELDVNAVLPEDSRIRSLILNYSESCPDGVEKTPDIYMYDLPEYELVLNVLPDDSALCPISQRIRYGTWFTGPDQIILSPAMAEGLMGEHAERLIGSSIVRNLYQRGEVSLQIVGITEELNDAERIWLGAAGVLQIDYGERVNPENERDLFYAGAAIMDGYRNDESFHTDSNGWQQVWFLFFKNYAAMDSFYQEYAGKMSETYGFNCRLEKAGLPIDYDLKWPLVSEILLIAAAFTVLLTGLFYGDLRRKEFQYNSRFLAVFEYAGFKKTILLSALTTLSLWELMKQFLTALGLTLVLTVCVNLLNHKKFLLPLEIFSFNPVLLGAFVLLLFGIAYTVLRISFRRFRMMSWYGYLSTSRDLL